MTDLFINPDGADHQAQAVLAYLRAYDGIEVSWNSKMNGYDAEPKVDRWHNCREQGYVVHLRSRNRARQLNIAFFEHRNSDSICAVAWEQITINPPTIDNMETNGAVYTDKFDVSHSVSVGCAEQMANWIYDQIEHFWIMTSGDGN